MIQLTSTGDFSNTEKWLAQMSRGDFFKRLDAYGRKGVDALANATPMDSGLTASSWGYNVIRKRGSYGVEWYNTNSNGGANVAILIQYGHGTGTGGYVSGRDYINPVVRPLFDQMAAEIWKEVTR